MKYLLLVLGLLVATSAQASGYWDEVVENFSVTAGLRWDKDPQVLYRSKVVQAAEINDQFFIGGALSLPLNKWADLGGTVDRDFVEAPNWSARVYVAIHPWSKY